MIKLSEVSFWKIIRNIVLAILSMGWYIPLSEGISDFFVWLYQALQPGGIDQGGKNFYFELHLAAGQIELGLLWLGLVLAFWSFVLANKIWPIKKAKIRDV